MNSLRPKLLSTLRGYTPGQFLSDATAGLIVGVVALPLAIAFSIASGVTPDKGLITAVIAGFLISVLGGSRVQIGGPTGAFVVIIYGIVQQHGVNGLIIATVMAGILLVFMGIGRLGGIIKFIPHPVIVGFTSGIAVIIFSSQMKDMLGLRMGNVPADFAEKWIAYFGHLTTINLSAIAVSVGCIIILSFWPRISKRIPGPLVALLLATIVTQIFHLDVETIGSRFGRIPSSLPDPTFPDITWSSIRTLFPSAITIAFLGAIESLLSAVVADGMIGGRHRSNMELIAQGIANIITPFFGGIPATGAIARTATNIRNGGRTPVAGMVHALVLLLIMLAFGRWVSLIPLPCLAAILIVVAYNMSEWRSFVSLLRSPRSDVVVLLVTFLLTVIIDLTVAIEIGLGLAVVLFIRRMVMVTNVGIITRELDDSEEAEETGLGMKRNIPEGVEVFEINGPFFFGAAFKFKEAMNAIGDTTKIRILRMKDVPAIDSTGMHTIEEVWHTAVRSGGHLLLADLHSQPWMAMEKSGLIKKIGEENVFGDMESALDRARALLDHPNLTAS